MHRRHLIGASCLILCACASNGGTVPTAGSGTGGTNTFSPPGPFTDFGQIRNPGIYVLNGSSRQASFTRAGQEIPGQKIASVGTPTQFTSGADAIARGGQVDWFSVRPAQGSIPFWSENDLVGYPPNEQRLYTFEQSNLNVAYFAEPFPNSFNYQTFGIWRSTFTPVNSGSMGVFSIGAPTAANAVPATGTASYSGFAAGNYIPADGTQSVATASMTLEANFVQQTIAFSTTATQVLPYGSNGWSPNPNLDLSGTLSLASGANGFSGTASTTGGGVDNAPMTGTADGLFYGPSVNEVGGAFWVSGGGVTTYAGGFGGKR